MSTSHTEYVNGQGGRLFAGIEGPFGSLSMSCLHGLATVPTCPEYRSRKRSRWRAPAWRTWIGLSPQQAAPSPPINHTCAANQVATGAEDGALPGAMAAMVRMEATASVIEIPDAFHLAYLKRAAPVVATVSPFLSGR